MTHIIMSMHDSLCVLWHNFTCQVDYAVDVFRQLNPDGPDPEGKHIVCIGSKFKINFVVEILWIFASCECLSFVYVGPSRLASQENRCGGQASWVRGSHGSHSGHAGWSWSLSADRKRKVSGVRKHLLVYIQCHVLHFVSIILILCVCREDQIFEHLVQNHEVEYCSTIVATCTYYNGHTTVYFSCTV